MTTQRAVAEEPIPASFADLFEAIVANVSRVLQGKDAVIRLALVCLAAEGHLLVEDVPGVGKTSLAKALARSLGLQWHRVQFTPDLLPSDITGVNIYDRNTSSFRFRPGGLFANVVLGDEINRASPKTQSALLEAMEERQVTVESQTYPLPDPFFVIATQNPLEHEGTYPLPESQLDRFLLRIRMGYPDRNAEVAMLNTHETTIGVDELPAVSGPQGVRLLVNLAQSVHVAPVLRGYIVDLAAATRRHPLLSLGMSPRAALALQRAARAHAAALGREYVVPDDIKTLIVPVVEHRLALSPDAQLAGRNPAEILADVLRSVAVPTGRSSD